MARLVIGIICGVVFGLVAVATMIVWYAES